MRTRLWVPTLLVCVAVATVSWLVYARLQDVTADGPGQRGERVRAAVPVQVAPVARGPIELRRTYTGTLVAKAGFDVAPKVGGRIELLDVELADRVTRGQVVARLEDDEFVQVLAQAEAELAVAEANVAEARSQLVIAERAMARAEQLGNRGMSSASELDAARADALARRAHVDVTLAQATRASAALETARIRHGYTQVTVDWHSGDDARTVAERYVEEGETVAANAPLVRVVELNPIIAVFFVTEREYARLAPGQAVQLATDAFTGETFAARIARIAPVFRESTRQARVEVQADNADLRLKPGMFVRATVVLERLAAATIIPAASLVRRDGRQGVFLVEPDDDRARWREVSTGIEQDRRVQVLAPDLDGRVVTLGQQFLDDGARVAVVDANGEAVQ